MTVSLKYFLYVVLAIFYLGCSEPSHKYMSANDWDAAGGNLGQTKFSKLNQINKENVSELEVVWTFHSGNTKGNVQVNPLIISGVVYVTTPSQELIAIDGKNGEEIWRFNPSREGESFGGVNRGLAYYKSDKHSYILYTSGAYLNAVDLTTGKAVASFGDAGRVNMNENLIKEADKMGITSPGAPMVFNDLVILGAMSWSSPANVSAFNVLTGKRVWIFNTIPTPKEDGYDSWEDTEFWKNGAGVNAWSGLSIDHKNGMVYFATGQPKDDFYRPNNSGEQLYGNCIVALDAYTGKRKWHYQTIHHDLWDLDLPCAPILTTLNDQGKKVPGVVQLSKTGNIFMFNRLTGRLLSEVEEREVPKSTLVGENAYPTQPFVKWPKPFSKQIVTKNDLTNISSEAHAYAQEKFNDADTGWFVPPSERGVIYYGIHGGAEWGGGSYDPYTNIMYVNSNELAWNITMRNTSKKRAGETALHAGARSYRSRGCVNCHGGNREGLGGLPSLKEVKEKYEGEEIAAIVKKGKGNMPSFSHIPEDEVQDLVSYLMNTTVEGNKKKERKEKISFRSLGYNKFLDKEGYPATKPPWGTLNAIDLTSGEIKWKTPLGEHKELTERGIPITGTENFGGSITTAGGLVFIGATRDRKFRAFDKDTGTQLWEYQLPFGAYAVPSTYAVNGKQYIVVSASGGGKLGGPTGDIYIAFSLPNTK